MMKPSAWLIETEEEFVTLNFSCHVWTVGLFTSYAVLLCPFINVYNFLDSKISPLCTEDRPSLLSTTFDFTRNLNHSDRSALSMKLLVLHLIVLVLFAIAVSSTPTMPTGKGKGGEKGDEKSAFLGVD